MSRVSITVRISTTTTIASSSTSFGFINISGCILSNVNPCESSDVTQHCSGLNEKL